MSEVLQEYVDSGSQKLRVDRANGVIRGVKLLGFVSRNGRRYQEQALVDAAKLYEGAKVNVNHPKGHPLSPRDYQDRLGVIGGVEFRPGEGLFGDLRFNPKHALSEQLVWDAEHVPQNVGLSHNVLARTTRQGDDTMVEAITKVQSIDLVADPASTQGLFEQQAPAQMEAGEPEDSSEIVWDELSVEHLRLHRPDILEEIAREPQDQVERLQAELQQVAVREAAAKRHERIAALLQEHQLPLPAAGPADNPEVVGESFMQSLEHAPDDHTLEQLVGERAALVRSIEKWLSERRRAGERPVSRDQATVASAGGTRLAGDAKAFAAAISG